MKTSKGIDKILNNPFSILGLPCNAEKIDIIKAQEKLNKLSKIGAENSYKTVFFSPSLPPVNRSAGIVQASMSKVDELENILLWFLDPLYLKEFNSSDIVIEFLNATNFEDIKYDCFLANYLCLLFEDFEFNQVELWKKVLNYIDDLSSCDFSVKKKIFQPRLNASVDEKTLNSFFPFISKHILSPLEDSADNSNPIHLISIMNIISEYDNSEFNSLFNKLLEQLILEIEKKCSFVFDFNNSIEDIKYISKKQVLKASDVADELTEIGKSIMKPLLRSHMIDSVDLDRIKDIFYNELMTLSNILAYGKSFKKAYSCSTQANIFAPTHKKSEITETLSRFKEFNDYCYIIDQAGGIDNLSYKEKSLIENEDIGISTLALGAIAGNSQDQLILGRLYLTSLYERKEVFPIPYDPNEGIKWIRKAAENGYSHAQLELGACYFTGRGVTQDIKTADFWIRKSANQGNPDAKNTLKMLENDYLYRASVSQIKTSIPASSSGCLIPIILSFLTVVILSTLLI